MAKTETKARLTEKDIVVHLINWETIGNQVTRKINNGKAYEIRPNLAMVLEPRLALLDNECVGWAPETKEDRTIELDVYGKSEPMPDGKGMQFDACPSYSIKVTLGELEDYLTGETKDLQTFMDNRYDYNGRIIGNRHNFMRYFNGES